MRKLFLIIALAIAAAATGAAQSSTPQRIVYRATLPATCSPATASLVRATVAPYGLFNCTATNTWTAVESGAGGAAGVSSFNLRTGAVSLQSSDVSTALGYSPLSPTGNGSGLTSVNAASISGQTLANLDARYTAAGAGGNMTGSGLTTNFLPKVSGTSTSLVNSTISQTSDGITLAQNSSVTGTFSTTGAVTLGNTLFVTSTARANNGFVVPYGIGYKSRNSGDTADVDLIKYDTGYVHIGNTGTDISLDNDVEVFGAISQEGGSFSTDGSISAPIGTVSATRLISTVATGTSPLTVASTTLVSNLNAERVGGQTLTNLDARYTAAGAGGNMTGSGLTTNFLPKVSGTSTSLVNSTISQTSDGITLAQNSSVTGTFSTTGAVTLGNTLFVTSTARANNGFVVPYGIGYKSRNSGDTADVDLIKYDTGYVHIGNIGADISLDNDVEVFGAISQEGGSFSTDGSISAPVGTVSATRLISTVATGTSPLQVTSTTLVSNLNAERVGGQTLTNLDSTYINASGDTMTGLLEIQAGNPTHGGLFLYNPVNNADTAGSIPAFTIYRTGKSGVSYSSMATITLGRFSQSSPGSNTQLDILLGAGATDVANVTALSLRADGAHTIFGTLGITGGATVGNDLSVTGEIFGTTITLTDADIGSVYSTYVRLFGGTRPACASSNRGTIHTLYGGAGVADVSSQCQKTAADTYAWVNF